jgi:hypothetical protein
MPFYLYTLSARSSSFFFTCTEGFWMLVKSEKSGKGPTGEKRRPQESIEKTEDGMKAEVRGQTTEDRRQEAEGCWILDAR